MKLLLLLSILLTGCTSTKVFGPDGKKILDLQANATGVHFQSGDTSLSMETVDHSTATTAAGRVVRPSAY